MKLKLDRAKRVPLYEQCARVLRAAIEDGTFAVHEFLPSERELSEMLEVQRITLRQGLAALVRDGMIESIPGAGNRVVRRKSAREQATKLVGCVMERKGKSLVESPFYADILEGIESEVTGRGYNLVFSSIWPDDMWHSTGKPKASPKCINTQLDGVLLIGGVTDEVALAYLKRGVRVGLVDRSSTHPEISSIVPDNFAGTQDATKYLISLGHRRIAFLGAPEDPTVALRHGGYAAALRQVGLDADVRDQIVGGYGAGAAHAAMKKYLAQGGKKATAIVCVNDEAALGVMRAIQEKGIRVPQGMSVIGFDDIDLAAHATPSLSTVRVDRRKMGQLAANGLLSQLESGDVSSVKVVLQADLQIRESCAPPPSP
jgi:DNA-binding LacI/PurR family transcriptional regulator